MTKKIFIHIGTYKTGTSAIQHEAFTSSDLEANGVRYVRTGLNRRFHKHLRIFDSIIDDASNSRRRNGPNYVDYRTIQRSLIKEVSRGKFPYYFISEEELSFPSPDIAEALAFLKEMAEVRVLLVVRRQDYFLDSLYRQFVREWDRFIDKTFLEFIQDELIEKRGDFYTIASYWSSVFGKGNVSLIDFDHLRSGGCLVAEFFRRSGMPYLPKEKSEIVNPSLAAAEAEVVRRLAVRGCGGCVDREGIANLLLAKNAKYKSTFLSGAITDNILLKYRECNTRLEEYGISFAGALDARPKESATETLNLALELEQEVADAELSVLEFFVNKVSAAREALR